MSVPTDNKKTDWAIFSHVKVFVTHMFFGDGDIDLQFGLSYNLDLPQITPAPWFIFEKLTKLG